MSGQDSNSDLKRLEARVLPLCPPINILYLTAVILMRLAGRLVLHCIFIFKLFLEKPNVASDLLPII